LIFKVTNIRYSIGSVELILLKTINEIFYLITTGKYSLDEGLGIGGNGVSPPGSGGNPIAPKFPAQNSSHSLSAVNRNN